jgi:acyl carrier protein
LRGIVHAAVAMSQCPLRELDEETLAGMLASKVAGTRNLLALGAGSTLDFVVLFSSTTALLGAGGLAHYAAANGYLDAAACERRAAGFPVTSVNWGTWDEMRVASAEDRRGFLDAGLRPMASARALEALGAVISAGIPQISVASIEWESLRSLYEARRRRPFLARLGSSGTKATSARPRGAKRDLPSRLSGAPANERKDIVLAFVQGEVARILGIQKPEGIDPDQGLFDMGLDSLMAVDLKSRLEAGVGQPLPSTLTFNYPSVGALTNFLLQDILWPASEPVPAAAREAHPAEEAVASRTEADLSEEERPPPREGINYHSGRWVIDGEPSCHPCGRGTGSDDERKRSYTRQRDGETGSPGPAQIRAGCGRAHAGPAGSDRADTDGAHRRHRDELPFPRRGELAGGVLAIASGTPGRGPGGSPGAVGTRGIRAPGSRRRRQNAPAVRGIHRRVTNSTCLFGIAPQAATMDPRRLVRVTGGLERAAA